ncbi:MAG: hypothetical protein QXP36_08050 [Conexivisphaerales archaeon]
MADNPNGFVTFKTTGTTTLYFRIYVNSGVASRNGISTYIVDYLLPLMGKIFSNDLNCAWYGTLNGIPVAGGTKTTSYSVTTYIPNYTTTLTDQNQINRINNAYQFKFYPGNTGDFFSIDSTGTYFNLVIYFKGTDQQMLTLGAGNLYSLVSQVNLDFVTRNAQDSVSYVSNPNSAVSNQLVDTFYLLSDMNALTTRFGNILRDNGVTMTDKSYDYYNFAIQQIVNYTNPSWWQSMFGFLFSWLAPFESIIATYGPAIALILAAIGILILIVIIRLALGEGI